MLWGLRSGSHRFKSVKGPRGGRLSLQESGAPAPRPRTRLSTPGSCCQEVLHEITRKVYVSKHGYLALLDRAFLLGEVKDTLCYSPLLTLNNHSMALARARSFIYLWCFLSLTVSLNLILMNRYYAPGPSMGRDYFPFRVCPWG